MDVSWFTATCYKSLFSAVHCFGTFVETHSINVCLFLDSVLSH